MKQLLSFIGKIFFQEIDARPFGLMRIAWAGVTLTFLLFKFSDATLLYSHEGLIAPEAAEQMFRSSYRFTLLTYIGDPFAVHSLMVVHALLLFCALIGLWTRGSVIMSTLLLFSFHEGNLLPLGGGDTVLRHLGFILMICPEVRAFSLDQARKQWNTWSRKGELEKPLSMPIWPWRLLLWQMIVIYISAGWEKSLGTMWTGGTAFSIPLHHQDFSRLPIWLADRLSAFSPLASRGTLLFEFAWIAMLIPSQILRKVTGSIHASNIVRQSLLIAGVVFHGCIFAIMNVGTFSQAMLTGYLGLLRREDFSLAQRIINNSWKGKIFVLFDGNCNFCGRSVFGLLLADWLKRLRLINYHDTNERKKAAPDIPLKKLDAELHIRLPNGKTESGFRAFRLLAHHLPIGWPLLPLLYLPGASIVGQRIYMVIAAQRRCRGACELPK